MGNEDDERAGSFRVWRFSDARMAEWYVAEEGNFDHGYLVRIQ